MSGGAGRILLLRLENRRHGRRVVLAFRLGDGALPRIGPAQAARARKALCSCPPWRRRCRGPAAEDGEQADPGGLGRFRLLATGDGGAVAAPTEERG